MVLNQVSYKLEHRLGVGASAHVLSAIEAATGALVAVKKSRVSLRFKRTILEHEAQVILSLPHHPGIPAIYAYGRLPHFEYLAMELLGPTLGDIQAQPRWVRNSVAPQLAIQMVSALQHIHSHGLIHVDVKPGNILLVEPDREQLRLTDYGLARLINNTKPTRGYLGTLNYASLNSHHGLALSQRDDLESLAYTIFAFLRPKLPWTKWDFGRNMLHRSRELQIFEKKKRWSGSRLAEGFDPVYGQFLEYARNLKHLSAPNYDQWIMIFTSLCMHGTWLAFDYKASVGSEKEEPRSERERLPITVEAGQLCYIRLLPTLTLEGYTGRRKDPSFYDDPSFSEALWNTRPRPAVILDTGYLADTRYIRALPISLCYPSSSLLKWRLVPSKSLREEEELMVSGGNWPPIQEDIWCFCMHGMTTFRQDPDETRVIPTYWKVMKDDVAAIIQQIDRTDNRNPPDPLAQASLHVQSRWLQYTSISALAPTTLDCQMINGHKVEWNSKQGWLEEHFKLKKMLMEKGYHCVHPGPDDPDSYYGDDFESWDDRQGERSTSLDLSRDLEIDIGSKLPMIVTVA